MYGSRALARVVLSRAERRRPLQIEIPASWRQLPTLSRYAGHVILTALFVILLYGVSAGRLGLSSLDRWVGRGRSLGSSAYLSGSYDYLSAYARAETGERYLEQETVPYTMISWSETLPQVAEPRRLVRTSITMYTVQAGDTLIQIANAFGLQPTSLLYANETLAGQNDTLKIGQELVILPVDGAYHKVARGETIQSIAARYKVETDVIAQYPGNKLEPPYSLQAGQYLIIPGGTRPYVPPQVQTYSRSTGTTVSAAPAASTETAAAEAVPAQGGTSGTGQFAWPMSGKISQGYWQGHRAIDIYAPRGTPIIAADSGTVAAANWAQGYGRMVVIDHGNGYQTLYAHMDAFFVQPGQAVNKGDVIGKCGSTGNSTGPHVHFEVRSGGSLLNPFNYLP
ncbi:MAG: peptidoglycan DD-metalloendopeptidase family protein [Anaerolineae bacterium]|jgi:murein DD-endopeptidase MepM/ murein hydrolase activator NlpD|nr:peptidoglycan DD-metalloendopeptidase family protein [Chloroflexota bacterium]